jgi:hypothetical protein
MPRALTLVSGEYFKFAVIVILGTAEVQPGFDPGAVHARFVVDTVPLGQVFL